MERLEVPPRKFIERILEVSPLTQKNVNEADRYWFNGLSKELREHAYYIVYLSRHYDIIDILLNRKKDKITIENAMYFYKFGFDTWLGRKELEDFFAKETRGPINIAIPVSLAAHVTEIETDLRAAYDKIEAYDIPAAEKRETFDAYAEKYINEMLKRESH